MDSNDLPLLNPLETRVLGCLAEKKTLTPDVYPMSLNGVHGAANQKTARDPVMTPEIVEDMPEDDTIDRLRKLNNPAVAVRAIAGADAQFSGDAFEPTVEAIDAYLRSIFPEKTE